MGNFNPNDLLIDPDEDYRVGDVQSWQEAQEAKTRLLMECAKIRDQLAEAEENGEPPNSEWRRRATMAIRMKSQAAQHLQVIAGEMRRDEKADFNRKYDGLLIAKLRLKVGDEVFMQCVRDAKAELTK